MWLLIVICLTGTGTMIEPFVASARTEAECLRVLPVAVEVVQKQQGTGYAAVCVMVKGPLGPVTRI
jgi:hypothetical protein